MVAIIALILGVTLLQLRPKTSAAAFERFKDRPWFSSMVWWAEFRGFDPRLIAGQIMVESSGRAHVVNSATDAHGLMQIRPIVLREFKQQTGQDMPVDLLLDPEANLRIGTWYMERLRDHYKMKTDSRTLLAYNNGPTAVRENRATNRRYPGKVFEAAGLV